MKYVPLLLLVALAGCSEEATDGPPSPEKLMDLKCMASDLVLVDDEPFLRVLRTVDQQREEAVIRIRPDGSTETLLSSLVGDWEPTQLQTDGTDLFVLQGHLLNDSWRLVRVAPGQPVTHHVVLEGQEGSIDWRTNTAHLLWCDANGLHRTAKSGGASENLLSTATYCDVHAADDVAVLYEHSAALYLMPATGGDATKVVDGDAGSAAMDAENVYFAGQDERVYWVPRSGGTPVPLADGGGSVSEHGPHVYFRRVDDSGAYYEVEYNVWRVAKQGGAPEGYFTGHRTYAHDFGTTHTYLATSNALYRVPY